MTEPNFRKSRTLTTLAARMHAKALIALPTLLKCLTETLEAKVV
jgi:hypothetical protein